MPKTHLCLLFFTLVLLVSCSSVNQKISHHREPTLADLKPASIPRDIEPIAQASIDTIEAQYRAALDITRDPDLRERIRIRLADIEMTRGEAQQIQSNDDDLYFERTIEEYERILANLEINPNPDSEERILYRLSKAYALDGALDKSNKTLGRLIQKYPNSTYAAEAQFRRGEQAFSNKRYRRARQAYETVAKAGNTTPYHLNALYMQGWSEFKLSQYDASVDTFTQVLDQVLPENIPLEKLPNSKKSLATDTFRVLGFAFSYLDGAVAISNKYQQLGARHYEHYLYRQLGEQYLDKKRYRDAADTYQHFIEKNPNSDYGPDMLVQMLAVYERGGFPSEIVPAKEQYIKNYGINSRFWAQRDEAKKQGLRKNLHQYLDELSSYYHSEAQVLAKLEKRYQQKEIKKRPASSLPFFTQASSYYQDFITTFPKDEKVLEKTYLMAETLLASNKKERAIIAFEQVAYAQGDHTHRDLKRGADAGYAAILTQNDWFAELPEGPAKLALKEKQISSAIQFADTYNTDKRANRVLSRAAEDLLSNGQFEKAIALASSITQQNPPAEKPLRKTAWMVQGHSLFDLMRYAKAETAYRNVLGLLSTEQASAEKDKTEKEIKERVAASIFKQAEQDVAQDDKNTALTRLLSINQLVPDSDIAIAAQYDAANYLIELKQWGKAEKVLLNFQRRYPGNNLTPSIEPKLVSVYQETQQWNKAAAVLSSMANNRKDPEARRNAAYLSAELYRKSDNLAKAYEQYENYVKRYPQPFDLAIEARHELATIAASRGRSKEVRYWQQELIKADQKAGKNKTDRSRYLAAQASHVFANEAFARFEKIKLTLPIKKSLKAKRSAMDRTLKAYEQVLKYGVAEFSTAANHHVGEVYANLHKDLLDSQRPKGLDALTLEQYEILLEEQAYPFKTKAVEILEGNAQRSWQGFYDDWVKKSFKALAELLPARYGKKETVPEFSRGLH